MSYQRCYLCGDLESEDEHHEHSRSHQTPEIVPSP
jgi:hypothetical protein